MECCFFVGFANRLGSYVCLDENTQKGSCKDIARIMIRVPIDFKLKENMKVVIDEVTFFLVLREDSYGHVRLMIVNKSVKSSISSSSLDSVFKS